MRASINSDVFGRDSPKRGSLPMIFKTLQLSVAFLLTISIAVLGQSEKDFIVDYNNHIDPQRILDTLRVLSVTIKMDAQVSRNLKLINVRKEHHCRYYSDGTSQVVDARLGIEVDPVFFPPLNNGAKNAIKANLQFIASTQDSIKLQYAVVNDSITVIKKSKSEDQSLVYTFDSKTKDLIQIENNVTKIDAKYSSITRFLDFQRIDGLLIPKRVQFWSDLVTATLDYSNVVF